MRGMASARRAALLALALASAAPQAAPQAAPGGGGRSAPAWSWSLDPARPEAGTSAVLAIRIEGLRSPRVGQVELDPGLSLEATSARTAIDAGGGAYADIRLELRILAAGPRRVAFASIEGEGASFRAGPFTFEAAGSGGAAAARAPEYRWVAPSAVTRWQSFAARLESLDGSPPPPGALAAWTPPAGLALEAADEALSWTVTALEEGRLLLPEAEISLGRNLARAPAARIESRAPPPGLEATRAIGILELVLRGPRGAVAGERLELVAELSGSGNFPLLAAPRLELLLDGKPLDPGTVRRTDALVHAATGYSGSGSFAWRVSPPAPGRLEARLAPYLVLGPEGRLRSLEAPRLVLAVEASEAGRKAAVDPPLARLALDAARRLGRRPGLEGLSAALEAGRDDEARRLLASATDPDGRGSPAGPVLRAVLDFRAARGRDRGAPVAAVYRLARARPFDPFAREAARAFARELGAGEFRPAALPPPALPLVLALLALGAALLRLPRFARGGRTRPPPAPQGRRPALPPSPSFPVQALCLLALALALLIAAAASASAARREYALAWAERASSVPSAKAEGGFAIAAGAAGEVLGRSEGWVGLRFADGSLGWLPEEYVYSY